MLVIKILRDMLYILLIIVAVIVLLFLFMLNIWIKRYINPNTYPNNIWYRHNLQRNYNFLLLGNGIVRHLFNVDWRKGSGFNLALRNQTLRRDFEVLKQNFSILKEGGYAIFALTADDFTRMEDVEDKRPYIYTQYSYTLSTSHRVQNYKKLCKYYPIFMFRPIDVFYLIIHLLGKDEQTFLDKRRQVRGRPIDNPDALNSAIVEIKEFCNVREIQPIFLMLDIAEYRNPASQHAFQNMSVICDKIGVKAKVLNIEKNERYSVEDFLRNL